MRDVGERRGLSGIGVLGGGAGVGRSDSGESDVWRIRGLWG